MLVVVCCGALNETQENWACSKLGKTFNQDGRLSSTELSSFCLAVKKRHCLLYHTKLNLPSSRVATLSCRAIKTHSCSNALS